MTSKTDRPPGTISSLVQPQFLGRVPGRSVGTSQRTACRIFIALVFLLASVGQTIGAKKPPPKKETPKDLAKKAAGLVKQWSNSLVFVEGKHGSGSGFVCTLGEAKVLITNVHVLAGEQNETFTLLDRAPLQLGAGALAVDHDIAIFAVTSDTKPFQFMDAVETNATIGDAVVVLGNAGGAHVIHPVLGKISGIGPNLVEVDAPFQPGNSGSPIIHLHSGKVIGVATYATTPNFSIMNMGTAFKHVRRFGYRIDSIKKWQPFDAQNFWRQNEQLKSSTKLSHDLFEMWPDLASRGQLTPGLHDNPAIKKAVADYIAATKSAKQSANLEAPRQSLILALRAASQTDMMQTKARVTIDYFLRHAGDEAAKRESFFEAFEKLLKVQAANLGQSQESPGVRRR